MSSGTKISEMTDSLTEFPSGAFVPMVVEEAVGSLSPSRNYRYDAGQYLAKYSALAADTGAELIGTSNSTTVQAELDDRPTFAELSDGTGGSLIGLLSLGVGAVVRTLLAWWRDQPLTPESFGATGNGSANDASAFTSLITAAQAFGLQISLKAGTTYGLGAASWTGIAVTLSKDLIVNGNGATLKLLNQPTQSPIAGSGNPFLKFDGDSAKYRLQVRDLCFDLNGIKSFCLSPYRCTLDIQGCKATNGGITSGGSGNSSIFLYANACSGLIEGNYTKNIGYGYYLGHTDANMYCDGIRLIGNRGEEFHASGVSSVRGDFAVGVLKNSVIEDNIGSAVFSGIALAGSAATSMISENVSVIGNQMTDCSAQGIQMDVVGATKNRNIALIGNTLKTGATASAGLYLVSIEKFAALGNAIDVFEYGIFLDNATDGTVDANTVDCGGASTPRGGIVVSTTVGSTAGIPVNGNTTRDFTGATGIVVASSGAVGAIPSAIAITGNYSSGNATGIAVLTDAGRPTVDCLLSDNVCKGNTLDLKCDAADVVIGENAYDTEENVQYLTFTDADTTPSVAGRTNFRANNTAGTSITAFDDGVNGQTLLIYAGNGNTTYVHSAGLVNPGAANITTAANEFICYRRLSNVWYFVFKGT